MPELQILRHARPAQIEVPVLQPQIFTGLRATALVNLKRRRLARIQNFERIRQQFHFTGGKFRVDRAFRSLANLALDGDDKFTAQRLR